MREYFSLNTARVIESRKMRQMPMPPVAQSKVGVCGHSLAGTVVQIPPGAWMFVSWQCCVLSGRGLCVGLITRPKEFYRVWCVWVWSRSPVRGGHGPESGRSTTERAWGRWDSWKILHDLGEMRNALNHRLIDPVADGRSMLIWRK